ncbi:hypothetical protein B0H19DRAFT_1234515 [Mycena capillaripes]|nr:hypothetical protein B0H19DRAFT_1234515 [Mycena capillaripes]
MLLIASSEEVGTSQGVPQFGSACRGLTRPFHPTTIVPPAVLVRLPLTRPTLPNGVRISEHLQGYQWISPWGHGVVDKEALEVLWRIRFCRNCYYTHIITGIIVYTKWYPLQILLLNSFGQERALGFTLQAQNLNSNDDTFFAMKDVKDLEYCSAPQLQESCIQIKVQVKYGEVNLRCNYRSMVLQGVGH